MFLVSLEIMQQKSSLNTRFNYYLSSSPDTDLVAQLSLFLDVLVAVFILKLLMLVQI